MPKSTHSAAYRRFCAMLRETREAIPMTQAELSRRLRVSQSYVSKCERAELRLDLIEVRRWCHAMGVCFSTFAADVDAALPGQPRG